MSERMTPERLAEIESIHTNKVKGGPFEVAELVAEIRALWQRIDNLRDERAHETTMEASKSREVKNYMLWLFYAEEKYYRRKQLVIKKVAELIGREVDAIGFDDYDNSIEIRTKDGVWLTKEERSKVSKALGFMIWNDEGSPKSAEFRIREAHEAILKMRTECAGQIPVDMVEGLGILNKVDYQNWEFSRNFLGGWESRRPLLDETGKRIGWNPTVHPTFQAALEFARLHIAMKPNADKTKASQTPT